MVCPKFRLRLRQSSCGPPKRPIASSSPPTCAVWKRAKAAQKRRKERQFHQYQTTIDTYKHGESQPWQRSWWSIAMNGGALSFSDLLKKYAHFKSYLLPLFSAFISLGPEESICCNLIFYHQSLKHVKAQLKEQRVYHRAEMPLAYNRRDTGHQP